MNWNFNWNVTKRDLIYYNSKKCSSVTEEWKRENVQLILLLLKLIVKGNEAISHHHHPFYEIKVRISDLFVLWMFFLPSTVMTWTCMFWDCGTILENMTDSHPDCWRTCKLHIEQTWDHQGIEKSFQPLCRLEWQEEKFNLLQFREMSLRNTKGRMCNLFCLC